MLGNIQNIMTDLFDTIDLKEDQFEWEYSVDQNVMDVTIRLPASIFPVGVRIPKMVCKLQISRLDDENPQIVFLEKNTLFCAGAMTQILDFLAAHPIDVV